MLERNPHYREHRYDEQPPADDARSQAIASALAGRTLPMIDRVEVYIVEEAQPRWLGFLNAEHDLLERLPNEFAAVAIPNNELAPNLKKRGVAIDRVPLVDVTFSYFGMEHPVVGGYTPDKVALRRAIALAYDGEEEIALVRQGQAIAAQAIVPPLMSGYDPALKTEMSEFRPRAREARCSTCTATSTRTATAGATCPTARRCGSSTRRSPTRARASCRSCGRST